MFKQYFSHTKKSQGVINEKPLLNKTSIAVEKVRLAKTFDETVSTRSSSRLRKKNDIRDFLHTTTPKPKGTPKKRRCDDTSPKTPRKRANLFKNVDQTQSNIDDLVPFDKTTYQNVQETKTTSNQVSINEEVKPKLEKNKKQLNEVLKKDEKKSLELNKVICTPEKKLEEEISVLKTPMNRKLDVSECLMKIKKRKKLQAIPKMMSPSEMLQKVNQQSTEETTINTNKEVQQFVMSADNVASISNQDQLVLPKSYNNLLEIFKNFDTVLRFLNNRGEKAVWNKVKESVKKMCKTSFTTHHLAQMKYILPSAFDLKVEKVTNYESRNIRKDYDIVIKPNIDSKDLVVSDDIKKMTLTTCLNRLKQFKLNLLALVKCEHQKFLVSQGINDMKHEKLLRWHKNFNVNQLANQIPSAYVPCADTLNNQTSCVRRMLFETKMKKDEQVAEVQKLLKKTIEEDERVENLPKYLQKVPKALLQKIREKEKKLNIRNMINNDVGSKNCNS